MAKIYNAKVEGLVQTFDCNEGNVTIETVSGVGGDITKPKFASPIKKGDLVKITGDLTVSACAAGDAPIGIAVANPRMVEEPTTGASFGSYTPRRVSVRLFGHELRTVPLEAANSAVSVGNNIKVGSTTAQRYDKGSNGSTNAIALEAATASSGAKIAVLFGYYGV